MKLTFFSSTWCGPCKQMKPIIKELTAKHDIDTVDATKDPQTCKDFNVTTVPTLILWNEHWEPKDKIVGYHSKQEIEDWLKQYEK